MNTHASIFPRARLSAPHHVRLEDLPVTRGQDHAAVVSGKRLVDAQRLHDRSHPRARAAARHSESNARVGQCAHRVFRRRAERLVGVQQRAVAIRDHEFNLRERFVGFVGVAAAWPQAGIA
jgi:hypothetical protein